MKNQIKNLGESFSFAKFDDQMGNVILGETQDWVFAVFVILMNEHL